MRINPYTRLYVFSQLVSLVGPFGSNYELFWHVEVVDIAKIVLINLFLRFDKSKHH
jgi:hypothetical protein